MSAEKQSLTNKVEIKADSEFYDWIDVELKERFKLLIAAILSGNSEREKAITKTGR